MKRKIYLLLAIFSYLLPVSAQQDDYKIEHIVNEQFSTLLEGLLKNGKIEEADAKSYLQTVFANDEGVNNYLAGLELSRQIKNFGKENISLDSYVQKLGSNLLGLVPPEFFEKLRKNPHYIGWKLGQEMNAGRLSMETLSDAVSLLADSYKENQRNREFIVKLKEITPKASQLKPNASKNKSVANDARHTANWKTNPLKIEKGFFSDESTYNKVTIEEGKVLLEPSGYFDKFSNIYKNKEKFDFSKNFRAKIKLRAPKTEKHRKLTYQGIGVSILIGQYYLFESSMLYSSSYEDVTDWSAFSVKMPEASFTPIYANFYYENSNLYSKDPNVWTVTNSSLALGKSFNGLYKKSNAVENAALNFRDGCELTISYENGMLKYFINGVDTGIEKAVTYMPNKFAFDIKGQALIESLILEHL